MTTYNPKTMFRGHMVVVFIFLSILTSYILSAQRTPPMSKPDMKDTLYCVQNTAQEWQVWLYKFENIKFQLKKSDLPSRDVTYLIDSLIVPMQYVISSQVRPQIERREKADSAGKPNNKQGK